MHKQAVVVLQGTMVGSGLLRTGWDGLGRVEFWYVVCLVNFVSAVRGRLFTCLPTVVSAFMAVRPRSARDTDTSAKENVWETGHGMGVRTLYVNEDPCI